MKYLIIIALILNSVNVSAQTEAKTKDGKEVLLYDDGTWKYADELTINIEPYLMPAPKFKGDIGGDKREIKKTLLKKISSKANSITDDDSWFINNGLALKAYEVPNSFMRKKGNVPARTPASYKGLALVEAIYDDDHIYLVYGSNFSEGRYLIIADKELKEVKHVLDFKNYAMSPKYITKDISFINQRISWVELEDSILYVSHSHRTYAESSKGMNAYITAINMKDYSVIWRSKPLICNSSNFEIVGDIIISGYGFTDEKDYLYTLNKYNGKEIQKLKLKTGPDYIIRKEDKIYVRTYNTDYVFGIKP